MKFKEKDVCIFKLSIDSDIRIHAIITEVSMASYHFRYQYGNESQQELMLSQEAFDTQYMLLSKAKIKHAELFI